jgi:hypothetical protein
MIKTSLKMRQHNRGGYIRILLFVAGVLITSSLGIF